MTNAQTDAPSPRKPLRLWPGVLLLALLLACKFVLPAVVPEAVLYGILGGLACALAIFVWWLFFSRAPWAERLGALLLTIAGLAATRLIIHTSIAGASMGFMFPLFGLMSVSVALVVGLLVARRLPARARRAVLAASILLACGAWTLVRTEGVWGNAGFDFAWRWSKTPEERLLAQGGDKLPGGETTARRSAPVAAETGAEWPGFRGAGRDGVVRGVRIATDWKAQPPVELWRRAVGPGWSSFAVSGGRVYTQEQRGEHEVVSCYDAATGEPVWAHRDAARFYESNGGAGPRATPTLSGGRLYTLGATGILNALEARDGSVVWSRNAADDTQTRTPIWGFSGSPLVLDDLVFVAAGGTLAAYDRDTGEPRWLGPKDGCCYSSPQRVTLQGVTQVVLMNGPGTLGVAPEDGRVLWQHPLPQGGRIVQPALTADGDLLLSVGEGSDLYRVAVAQTDGGWKAEERWTSEGLKPYYSDFVVHEGHAYGFDNGKIACVDLRDGARKWADGSYGSGQLVLLSDQGVLLVVSEQGELALVGAAPDGFKELARHPAVKGKTWNHPVVAGDLLLVRNAEEMVAFRLPVQNH
ncbi:MAG TPA: PQQ-binding-like beta-propeller repeat protein [Pyrinomonadaceae bacterium]|nr:PQQ-binding-like beta-propeller repeat protein [Pyrinomonadaceae bacterium]